MHQGFRGNASSVDTGSPHIPFVNNYYRHSKLRRLLRGNIPAWAGSDNDQIKLLSHDIPPFLLINLPVNWFYPMFFKERVGLAEWPASKESSECG